MEQLKKTRTQLKRSMTRLYNFIAGENASSNEIKVRIDEFEKIYIQYKSIQDEIDILCENDNDLQREDSYRAEIEDVYFKSKSIYATYTQDNLENTVVEGATTSTPHSGNDLAALLETMSATLTSVVSLQSGNMTSSNNVSQMRLPRIEIPDFDGGLSNWIRFRDLFNAMVDTKTNLSDVEKLEYLQTKLKGEASSIIKHLAPTNTNYRVAWELVKKRYDKPEKIKETYMRLLLSQSSIKNGDLAEIKRFYNNTVESYNALNVLYEDVDSWDPLLLYLFKEKLDRETIILWYRQQKDDERQTFKNLLDFLESRVIELENLEQQNQSSKYKKISKVSLSATTQSCPVCKQNHLLYACQQFKELDIEKRRNIVRKIGYCFNCLKENHSYKDCKSSSCKACGLKHNSLLHPHQNRAADNSQGPIRKVDSSQRITQENIPTTITINSSQGSKRKITILPTAIIMVRDKNNSLQPCRALLDTGAESTLILEACVQRLQLRRSYDRTLLYGIDNTPCYTRGKINMEIFAEKQNKTIIVETYCLSKLTHFIPSSDVKNQKLEYFQQLQLADPEYYRSNRIDIILGADVFPHCILDGIKTHPTGFPSALNSIFGWLIIGRIDGMSKKSIVVAHVSCGLDEQLQRFWETEECKSQAKHLTPDEQKAEEHFTENVQRLSDGRYMVKLPFKANSFQLGESKTAAIRRLESMERQFVRNTNLKEEFHKFMNEYIQLDHMEIANEDQQQRYYMPHHAVLKPSSTTTKLRVVFDASCKSSNNTSLNDHLLVGPTVQHDLYTVLLKFRKFKIGFTADIEKMYRQVLIHPNDRTFQCIFWRNSTSELPIAYQLKTVTYGTAAAAFLATRTLQQVAFDNSSNHPDESNEIINNFYVDDYMSCSPDLETAASRQKAICSILSSSGFNLRKWSTNSQQLLNSINPEDRSNSSELVIDYSEKVKTLGLIWNTESDCFQYSVEIPQVPDIITKRHVLSLISKIYDPIGWISPVVIRLKIFMQHLWLKSVGWDEDLANDLKAEWLRLQHNIENIKDLQIPRWFNFSPDDRIELHGFADSSELAYAAAIYVRVTGNNGSVSTCLLTAKTRVAPIKQITLPRLELCAAQLMVKLMVKVQEALNFQAVPAFGWTDSTVVLAWLGDHPRRWKTFIANRTSYIISIMPASQWHHIKSKENPADLATRGISSGDLINNSLWWQGPQVMQQFFKETNTSASSTLSTDVDLEERIVIATATIPTQQETDLLNMYSSYNKLLRVTALVLRFANNCKRKLQRATGFITTSELQHAHQALVKMSQQQSYIADMRILAAKKQLPSGNKLARLTPFLDDKGILRVGGRLENANISYDQKHPYIIHKNNALTQLIVREYHQRYLHAGTRQLQYLLALKYWIPDVTALIKRTVYQCTTCMRFRQKSYQQRMGDLPSYRLQPGSTFLHVGIDFAGPMLVRSWKGRGSKTYKCWIAVFVCLNTKAIHLEAVTELTTQAFLASLRRFTSRRGKPLHIYTDNGTNLVGCNQELKEVGDFLRKTHPFIYNELSAEQIQWHFIPPSAPNFGGIWEAGVKSVKYHLKRVLGSSSATYEELNTLLCQVECCLNSRPLCLKFEGDVDPLTPAHFLILRPMTSIPEESLIDVNVGRLSRWQYMQRLVQEFWSKWSKEYLSQLQKRPKWLQKIENLKVDDVVILKEDNLPPTHWLIGRIMATHPGGDGINSDKKRFGKAPYIQSMPSFHRWLKGILSRWADMFTSVNDVLL